MPHIRIVTLVGLPLVLTACAASTVAILTIGPPPSLLALCAIPMNLPERALTRAEVEAFWGRDRTALRWCQGRYRVLVGRVVKTIRERADNIAGIAMKPGRDTRQADGGLPLVA